MGTLVRNELITLLAVGENKFKQKVFFNIPTGIQQMMQSKVFVFYRKWHAEYDRCIQNSLNPFNRSLFSQNIPF